MENPIDFVKRPIAIVGMGKSGEAGKRLLILNRVKPDEICTFDDKAGQAQYSDPAKMMEKFRPRTLVVSPGYPLAKDWIQDFIDQGGEVTSELALAVHFLSKEKIIAVTGSVGKSTTVALLEAGLKAFAPDSFVGGNYGNPVANYVSDLIEKKRTMAPWLVLELSSYQLENCGHFRCDYSAVTYLTPNHMERYPSLQDYYETKWKLLQLTSKCAVLNQSGGDLQKFKHRKNEVRTLWTDHQDEGLVPYDLIEAKLLGSHNQDNLAIATRIGIEAGWPQPAFNAMKAFPGLPHRMENLGVRGGVQVINDSKATTIESVKTAAFGVYHQMDRKKQLILLVGGRDKNLPWKDLAELKKIQKLRVIFFGEVAEKAKKDSALDGPEGRRLWDALVLAQEMARPGDILLLSPGGTSLDEFKNFEERGKVFAEHVARLFR